MKLSELRDISFLQKNRIEALDIGLERDLILKNGKKITVTPAWEWAGQQPYKT
jgi:hypothetical protein